ncbi:MAG: TIGR03905 family TSCPD domain-containing protein [Mycoplasmataceae bacterium]|jgi:uncharacterized protein (TIGR03905 family)|nr:TIGR03905 family TSCPD domain-containing protein [Mycoplasmataceae bacterium]
MKFVYKPQGVCAREFNFEIEGNKILNFVSIGGCPGNLLGISELLKEIDVDEAIKKLSGVKCGTKPTSCPDQIAKALIKFKAEQK